MAIIPFQSLIFSWKGSSWKLTSNEYHDNTNESPGTRGMILDYVRAHPGTHLREIGRGLGLAMGDLQYNLDVLEKQHAISYARHGTYKFVLPYGMFGEKQSVILGALSIESQREIMLSLIKNPRLSQSELARIMGLTPPTVAWHMKQLIAQGIVERIENGNVVRFRVIGNIEEIERFIQHYHPTFWEKWSSSLADTILDLSLSGNDQQ